MQGEAAMDAERVRPQPKLYHAAGQVGPTHQIGRPLHACHRIASFAQETERHVALRVALLKRRRQLLQHPGAGCLAPALDRQPVRECTLHVDVLGGCDG